MNLPNAITMLRIALIPVFAVLFYLLPVPWAHRAAAAAFGLAAITDWLDGFLARQLGQTSPFGAFLDPIADKLMVAVVLVLLVQSDPSPALAIPAAIIIGREIAVSGLREFMAGIGQRATVAVATIGKIKTTVQMVALLLMVFREPFQAFPTYLVGITLLYIAAVLTLWSMVVYLRAAWPLLAPNAMGARERGTSLDSASGDHKIRAISRE